MDSVKEVTYYAASRIRSNSSGRDQRATTDCCSHQTEVLLPPHVFRVVEEGDEGQVGLTDLQVAKIDTPYQDMFSDAPGRPP